MNAALTSFKPMSLMLASAVAASTAVVGISLSASNKADFGLTATPGTATVAQGQAANFTINEQALNGFSGSVGLSVSGLPAGANATFSPNPMVKGTTTAALAIDTTAVAVSNSTLTVTGTSGSLTHTTTVVLNVTAAPPAPFSVSASPASASMLPGDTASFTVTITRQSGFTGAVALSVGSGAPAGGTATFTPATLTGSASTSTLNLTTKNNSPSGTYTLVINATNGGRTQSTNVGVTLASSGKSFGISLPNPITGLVPGARTSLDLKLTNTNSQPVNVTNLTVAVQSVTKSALAPADKPCGLSDYSIVQFSGTYPLVIPAGATRWLSALVTDNSALPVLVMNDADANQDGCQRASVSLVLSGAGQG